MNLEEKQAIIEKVFHERMQVLKDFCALMEAKVKEPNDIGYVLAVVSTRELFEYLTSNEFAQKIAEEMKVINYTLQQAVEGLAKMH